MDAVTQSREMIPDFFPSRVGRPPEPVIAARKRIQESVCSLFGGQGKNGRVRRT